MTQEQVRKLMSGGFVPRQGSRPAPSRIVIAMPLPPKILHSNSRTKNYKWRAAETKKYREACRLSACGTLFEQRIEPPVWKLAECQCTFYLERRRDHDGLISWMKAAFDSLQGIVIENDSGLIHLPPKQITAKEANGERKVLLTITERRDP